MAANNKAECAEECLDECADAFFKSAPPLNDRNDIKNKVENFVEHCLDSVSPLHSEALTTAVKEYSTAVKKDLLLQLQFTTLFEYLQILHIISMEMKKLGMYGMFYLAAAVSDFYVPWNSMTEHKIQSGPNGLAMQLSPVPKMLTLLRKYWCPSAFCVSFKLETDIDILLKKAQSARNKYSVHAVVANELSTRKERVIVVTQRGETVIKREKDGSDVEEPIIDFLIKEHNSFTVKRQPVLPLGNLGT